MKFICMFPHLYIAPVGSRLDCPVCGLDEKAPEEIE